MIKICFNLFDAHSLFFPKDSIVFGGAEIRGVTIAGELAKNNSVSVIIKEHIHPINKLINNVRVISHGYYSHGGISFFNKIKYSLQYIFKFKNLISKDEYYMWKPYIYANASYYAAFEITAKTKNLLNFCKKFNKKLILFIASDGELSFDLETATAMHIDKSLAKEIISNAHLIFVQNEYQLNKLAKNFNIKGIQVNNPLPLYIDKQKIAAAERKYITWVGKSSKAKQPGIFIELAKQFPNEIFYMVMNKNDHTIYDHVLKHCPPNVIFKERLSFSEVNEVLNSSKAFINTSLYEGFPNTFLQAGYFSVPIISLNVNPNGFIDISKGGFFCSGSIEKIHDAIEQLTPESNLFKEMASNVNRYILQNYNAKSVSDIIINSINETTASHV